MDVLFNSTTMKTLFTLIFSSIFLTIKAPPAPEVIIWADDVNLTIKKVKSLYAIMSNESSTYDTLAYNEKENAAGMLQIRLMMLDEVNRICKIKGIEKEFTPEMRFLPKYSIEMFCIVQSYWNPKFDLKITAFYWNTGNTDTSGIYGGIKYWTKICNKLKSLNHEIECID